MSSYQDGYEKGYEDGISGKHHMTDDFEGIIGTLVDVALGVTESEEEWREGYNDGYEAGREEYEK